MRFFSIKFVPILEHRLNVLAILYREIGVLMMTKCRKNDSLTIVKAKDLAVIRIEIDFGKSATHLSAKKWRIGIQKGAYMMQVIVVYDLY